jgi:death-on-curing protein
VVKFIPIDEVYAIHEAILSRAATRGEVRDFALLHSAVERPKATYSGQELYPTIFAKAASLLQSICLNHAFTDGNKRTAWAATKRFLWLNGYYLQAEVKAAADFMVKVDNEKPDIVFITAWLKNHCRKNDLSNAYA